APLRPEHSRDDVPDIARDVAHELGSQIDALTGEEVEVAAHPRQDRAPDDGVGELLRYKEGEGGDQQTPLHAPRMACELRPALRHACAQEDDNQRQHAKLHEAFVALEESLCPRERPALCLDVHRLRLRHIYSKICLTLYSSSGR